MELTKEDIDAVELRKILRERTLSLEEMTHVIKSELDEYEREYIINELKK